MCPLLIASKLIILVLLGSIGGSLVFHVATIVFDSFLNKTLDISFISNVFSLSPLSLTFFGFLAVPGITGFGVAHVLVSYILLFRSRPQFWKHVWLYSSVLILASGLIGGLSMCALHLFGCSAPRQALLFTAPLGYWGAALLLSKSCRDEQ